ncbi:MAG: BREX system serine/threonine kinase PglW [Blastocatellia bacterium]|nr:BREX system serine/threonine kinase PglW [Blastocatellia bacterium]
MKEPRWNTVTISDYQWEQEGLDFVKDRLPNSDPYAAWANFEFIADDGSINEVDLLVMTPMGLFLIEIKSYPGILTGDAGTWEVQANGKTRVLDNPLFLANRKAKRLASLLKRQRSMQGKGRFPFVEALIFCSNEQLDCRLQGTARNRICLRDREHPNGKRTPGIISALMSCDYEGAPLHHPVQINRPMAQAIAKAVDEAGIRQSRKLRKVGDYQLETLLFESPSGAYQDWVGKHVSVGTERRVRLYNLARHLAEADRATLVRAAAREFHLLETLDHRGILQVKDFYESERGPALTFRQPTDANRLDFYVREHHDRLTLDVRLDLLRQIAETVGFAHKKRIFHRTLSPQSILVTSDESNQTRTQIFNWHLGFREGGSSSQSSRLSPTHHVEQLIEDASTIYLAPESISDPETSAEHLDIFSLGAIAYFLFTGTPPAATAVEMADKIRDGKGLNLGATLDGTSRHLQELIKFSTHPDVLLRWDTVADFLEQLDKVEDELTRPEDETPANPLDAKPGQKLKSNLTVKGRLGSGATAVAFLMEEVKPGKDKRVMEKREVVLKLADSPDHNDRLREEFAVLNRLRFHHIVEAFELFDFGPLAGFTMQKAANGTLAEYLRKNVKLNLDLLQRFGQDLLETVRFLEQFGTPHRDIKPENIGITPFGPNDALHLILFDFSLAGVSADNIRAGTIPYLDPFLELRKPKRWDTHAERFAVAMTLHEMTAGVLPKWGEGGSRPDMLECEVTLPTELYDPAIRERATAFFTRALRRVPAERFDNADDMLHAWREIFEAPTRAFLPASIGKTVPGEGQNLQLGLETPVAALPISPNIANALDRMSVFVVGDLLRQTRHAISHLKGVGNRTRREIVELRENLKARFAKLEDDWTPPAETESSGTTEEGSLPLVTTLDEVASQLLVLDSTTRGKDRPVVATYLGMVLPPGKTAGPQPNWPNQLETAGRCNVTRGRISQVIVKARQLWQKNPSLAALRAELWEIIRKHGGLATLDELSTTLLAVRGSVAEEPRRTRLAQGLIRAALEVEDKEKEPRFFDFKAGAGTFLTTIAEAEKTVVEFGKIADRLVLDDTLATFARAVEDLSAVRLPAGMEPPPEARLVRLAVAASTTAALSTRLEIYPAGMAALKALKLAQGGLTGTVHANGKRGLLLQDIIDGVRNRYPAAETLPQPPALDSLLREIGFDLHWNALEQMYEFPDLQPTTGWTSTALPGTLEALQPTPAGKFTEITPEIADARLFEKKLAASRKDGGFLALLVAPRDMKRAEIALAKRFQLEPRNVDEILISEMRRQALEQEIDWGMVLASDAARHDSYDWKMLLEFVSLAIPAVETQLAEPGTTVLAVNPGLLARYDQLQVLEELRERAGRSGQGIHGLWVLLASDQQSSFPSVNGKVLPVIGSGQWSRVTETWISQVLD